MDNKFSGKFNRANLSPNFTTKHSFLLNTFATQKKTIPSTYDINKPNF